MAVSQDAQRSSDLVVGFAFGVAIATLTAPVGVSGAVFLLPVQLSVLNVPSPSVTPTNGGLRSSLARLLLSGTIPGVVLGAVIRVYLLPGGTLFRLLVDLFLLPLGVWLLVGSRHARDRKVMRGEPPS